jgi:hypothetical protein
MMAILTGVRWNLNVVLIESKHFIRMPLKGDRMLEDTMGA